MRTSMASGDENLVVNTTAFPTRSPPTQVSSTSTWFSGCPPILSWLGRTCPSGACGGFERPSRSAKDQVAAETARRTCRASDWRPDKRPRTGRSAECGYAHHCSHRQPGVLAALAAAQTPGRFSKWNGSPACRTGRQSRLPSGLSPGRWRRPHHRGKVAGTRVANAGMGDRRTIHISGCGCTTG